MSIIINKKRNQNMNNNILSKGLVLFIFFTLVSSLQWYQNSKNVHLDLQNYDRLVSQPGKYKFVKFFTRACRYCRLLKQVQEQLRSQRNWSFEFYDVDCTQHYDLCASKVTIQGFPYVAIYNDKGEFYNQIGGYYPVQIMRTVFEDIQKLNNDRIQQHQQKKQQIATVPKTEELTIQQKQQILKNINIPVAMIVQTTKTSQSNKNAKQKTTQHLQDKQHHQIQTKAQSKTPIQSNHQTHQPSKSQSQSSFIFSQGSLTSGLQLCVILLGYWMYNKLIHPYLNESSDQQFCGHQSKKYRTVQVPLNRNSEKNNEQSKKLLSDII